jgi:16S rRNA (uracil1498-N3)-methyltransferase
LRQRRFFSPAKCWQSDRIILEGEQIHHVFHVLRLRKGDTAVCFDETGRCAQTRIFHIDSVSGILEIVSLIPANQSSGARLTLAQAVVKSQRMDMIIQKTAELGVDSLIPFFSQNTVVELGTERQDTKRQRWRKIAVESAKQCGRNTVMEIGEFASADTLACGLKSYDLAILGCPCAKPLDISGLIASADNVIVIIGPEGGFTDREISAFTVASNCVPWRFSNTVLRAETAALSAIAIIQYALITCRQDV